MFDFLVSNRQRIPSVLPYPSSNKTHVYCFEPFWSNYSGDNAFSRGVICSYWGWWLEKTKFMECDVEGYICLPIFSNIPRLLLWLRIPPRVLGFCTSCGLVYFLVSGGLELFLGQMVVSSGNSALQRGCVPAFLIGMMHHYQCEVSYCYIYIGLSRTHWWLHSLETVWLYLQYS